MGSTVFVSGFFLLAAAGQDYQLEVHLVILALAAAVAVPILGLALVVAGSESLVGRAWASGFRELSLPERAVRGASVRALRYAGFLWLANGVALWLATLAGQL